MLEATSSPPAAAEAVAAVRQLNAEYIDAVRNNDAAWFADHMADDVLVITSAGQRLTRAQFIANMPTAYRSLTVRDVSLRAYGTTVQVDADAPFTLGDGSAGISRYIDTYAWIDGRWQVISAQYIRLPTAT